MTTLVGVVCESAADQRTGCDLADRVLIESPNGIAVDRLTELRAWIGANESPSLLLEWRHVGDLAKQKRIKVHGHFDGVPGEMDAHATRLALRLFYSLKQPPNAVILLRDQDGQDERMRGMQQARNDSKNPFPGAVVIGFARRMREAWVLTGFNARAGLEKKLLRELSDGNHGLGFDPTRHSERLQSSDPANSRSPKFVLQKLTDGQHDREEACWTETSLAELSQRGVACGLTAYLDEIGQILLPIVVALSSSSR
ncbi:MAG: hypothetical protein ACKV2Q_05060 [Planctomycetaceae bacterium]